MTKLRKIAKQNLKIIKQIIGKENLPESINELKNELDKLNANNHLPYMSAFCGFCLKGLYGFFQHEPFFIQYSDAGFANLCSDCYSKCYEKCIEILNTEETK